MKTHQLVRAIVIVACALGLGTSAFGKTKADHPKKDVLNYYEGFLLSSNVTGNHVKNLQHEDLGTIKNLILNPLTGRVRFAVLSVGGYLGIGETDVVVPWAALDVETPSTGEHPSYVLDTTKDKLKDAPRFDPAKLTDLYDRATAEPIFTYYDIIWFPDVETSAEKSAKAKKQKSTDAMAYASPAASSTASPHP
jgi:PRC-barrel domain